MQAIEARARSLSPPKVIGTVDRDAEPNSWIAAVVTEIRDADRRRPLITDFTQTVRQQEFEPQPFDLGVLSEPAPGRCCSVAALFGRYVAPSPFRLRARRSLIRSGRLRNSAARIFAASKSIPSTPINTPSTSRAPQVQKALRLRSSQRHDGWSSAWSR